jgi:DNA-binding beta-propeller fold protein YncE
VAAFDRTLSVINGTTCNATVNSSCNQPQPSTLIGNFPTDLATDEATNTVYVANNSDNTVSIVDGTHCQGSDTSGCGQSWPTFSANRPQALAFNPANRTLYVANGAGNSVWIIDTFHCNNHDTTDCTAKAVVPVDESPVAIGVLFDTHSVFVVHRSKMSVSIFDGATCNATNLAGCPTSPPQAVSFAVFPDTLNNPLAFAYITGRQIVIDQEMHTVFITTFGDTDLVVLNGDSCLPGHLNNCKPKISNPRTGGTPDFAAVDPSTQTIYVANIDEFTVSIAQDKY